MDTLIRVCCGSYIRVKPHHVSFFAVYSVFINVVFTVAVAFFFFVWLKILYSVFAATCYKWGVLFCPHVFFCCTNDQVL